MNNTEHIQYLTTYHFDKKMRLGCINDGGYVIAELENDSILKNIYDCYISAGVSNEESFSRDFIKFYNMNEFNSYAFDGTITSYPYDYTRNISYINKNIGNINNDKVTDLQVLFNRYNNIFLKMDIEGGEYDWIPSLSLENQKKIKQLVIEFHGINNDDWGAYSRKVECLKKLSDTHYIVHSHANNNAGCKNGIPDVIELTYVRKDYFISKPSLNTQPLPINNLDFPNNTRYNEIDLNIQPFVFK